MVAAARPAPVLAPRGRWAAARVRGAVAASQGRRTRAGVVIDVVIVVVCLLMALTSVQTQGEAWQHLPSWWIPVDVVVGCLASLALWWRRSRPLLVAVVAGLLGAVFIGAGMPALLAVYTLASLRPMWVAVIVTGVHTLLAIPYFAVVPLGGLNIVTWSVVMVLLYTSFLAVGAAVRSRRQVITGLVEAAQTERDEHERHLQAAQDAERSRIAREMHDVLAHRLSILSVHAGALEHRSRADAADRLRADQVQDAAGVIRRSAHAALEELRQVLSLLGASGGSADELGTAAPQPTAADLPHLLAEATAAGQQVLLQDDIGTGVLGEAPPGTQRTLYRVVQEGLTNARKHASGTTVTVTLRLAADPPRAVEIGVVNPLPVGVSGGEVPGSQAGLIGLAERVRLERGTLRTGVDDGSFGLHVRLPWPT